MSAAMQYFNTSTNLVSGLVMPLQISEGKMKEIRTSFTARPDDVFIVSYPKSGTTWMQQIVRLIRNNGIQSDAKITEVVPWLEGSDAPGFGCSMQLCDVEKMSSPRAFKTHLPISMIPSGPDAPLYIYVARNPKDVAVSLYSFAAQLFKSSVGVVPFSWEIFLMMFISGNLWYGSWFDHVLGWWEHKDKPNVLLVQYEDMQRDLPSMVKRVADFMGCDLTQEALDVIVRQCTFDSMRSNPSTNYSWLGQSVNEAYSSFNSNPTSSNDVEFLRKGTVGDWKNYFTPEQSAQFDRLYTEKTEDSGLDMVFELDVNL